MCVRVLLMADSIKCCGFPSVSLIIKGLKMTMMATDMKQTKGNVRSTHFLLLWAEKEKMVSTGSQMTADFYHFLIVEIDQWRRILALKNSNCFNEVQISIHL